MCLMGEQVPQLILNYKSGSADGISLAFLLVWLLGDITNLAGRSCFYPATFLSLSSAVQLTMLPVHELFFIKTRLSHGSLF